MIDLIKILITGTNSYIGNSFINWISKDKEKYHVDVISTLNNEWKSADFSKYDVVFNVAGIAHIKITDEMENLFYTVNRDLAIDICSMAKQEGIKQYIYLSSMNVFGDTNERITVDTKEKPSNFYGKSKLQADESIQRMNDKSFCVVSIRPPVVYGVGCKGNFVKLEKYSKWIPIFPDYTNYRSMIYIDNLCEFVKLIIDNSERGIFYPQNNRHISTTEIVQLISKYSGKKLLVTKTFNFFIKILIKHIRIIKKIFDNDYYDLELSNYQDFKYNLINFEESIKIIEYKINIGEYK